METTAVNMTSNGCWRPGARTGPNLLDPTSTIAGVRYQNFASDPLFASDGPTAADITQGKAGDCTFEATLLGIVSHSSSFIRNMIVSLGDGTYAVDLKPNGYDTYIRIDADLPVNASGGLVYSQLGHQNSTWVALLEKAWCFERPTSGSWYAAHADTYGNIDGGGSNELYSMLNDPYTNLDVSNLWTEVVNDMYAGQAVTIATKTTVPSSSGLLASHCYLVTQVNYGWVSHGTIAAWLPVSITLRNPWGGSNPFVTIGYTDVMNDFYGGWSSPL